MPRDEDLAALNALAALGIHDADAMPFDVPWTDAPVGELGRNSLQFHWGLRAAWKPESWQLPLMVKGGEVIVGVQGIFATNFAVTRQVGTGSWIGKAYQGRGIGREMRAAILHLAFAGLGAKRATSGAFENNAASIAVSRALGYRENGDDIKAPRGEPMRQIRFLLPREVWERNRRQDIEIQGLEPCLPMFGLDQPNA